VSNENWKFYTNEKYSYLTNGTVPSGARAYAKGVRGGPPLELDILKKLYYMRKGD